MILFKYFLEEEESETHIHKKEKIFSNSKVPF